MGNLLGAGLSALGGQMLGTGYVGNAAASLNGFETLDHAAYNSVADTIDFANGGVMTAFGKAPLRKYANGGIAYKPQLALFGEGSRPEAYVPLPDGRTIPVTIKGAGGSTSDVTINITVHENGGESRHQNGDDQDSTWKTIGERVKGVVMEELVKSTRPGGLLYR